MIDYVQQPALSALVILAQYYGISANPADIIHQFSDNTTGDLNEIEWMLADKEIRIKGKSCKTTFRSIVNDNTSCFGMVRYPLI